MACRFVSDAGVSWQEERGKPQWGCAGGEDEVGGSGLRKGSRVVPGLLPTRGPGLNRMSVGPDVDASNKQLGP